MDEIELALSLFNIRFSIEKTLKNLGVVRTQKTTEDYGEWLAAKLYNGNLSVDVNQIGWDIEAEGVRYQVKTHCKAETTPAQWSKLRSLEYSVIIIQLNPNYTIKKIYNISNIRLSELYNLGQLSQKENKYTLYWNRCDNKTEEFKEIYPNLFQ